MEQLQKRIAALEQKVGAGSEPPRNQMESKPGQTTMGRLADKNILITGGNSGIGLAAAQEFDREGARVVICGLNEGSLQAAKETLGAGSLAVRADVCNLTDLDRMFATIKREFGHLAG
jgi:NADP-dependent 3-hydroxy acid dehydrogenase YdfG